MRNLMMGLFIATSLASIAMAQQTMTTSGQIVSVRLDQRTFSVRDAQSQQVARYSVPAGTPITMAGGQARLGHLRATDRVDITYRTAGQGREATRISVPEPMPALDQRVTDGLFSTVTGRVEGIDFRDRTITVRGDQSGQRFSYAIPQNTRLTVGGEQARLGNLRRGDNVTLRFRTEAQERQVARVRVPQPATPLAQRPIQAPPAGVAAQAQPRQLPRTASAMPLLGLLGFLSLISAGTMRILRSPRVRR